MTGLCRSHKQEASSMRIRSRFLPGLLAAAALTSGVAAQQPGAAQAERALSRPDAAVFPGRRGGQDTFGHYAVVPDWPRPLAQLPEHAQWTWGATQSVFAESADRVFVLQRGELPRLERPPTQRLPDVGPSLEFPVFRLPFRDATPRPRRTRRATNTTLS
jgi:hypothetical protein